jgi:prevent-host-death family protein
MKVNIHQAKTHFSKLLQRVAGGEEITIARAGVPIARLVRAESPNVTRPMGMDRGSIYIADDFDAPLAPEVLARFHGQLDPPKNQRPKKKKRRA